jgi:hypothetical protein
MAKCPRPEAQLSNADGLLLRDGLSLRDDVLVRDNVLIEAQAIFVA